MSLPAEKPDTPAEPESPEAAHGRFLLEALEADLKPNRQLLARMTGQPTEPEPTPIDRLLSRRDEGE